MPENTENNELLWLRAETKLYEQRTLLTPSVAGALVKAGFTVVVERSNQRIFDDAEYEASGCTLKNAHAWHDAPEHAIVLGLKELAHNDGPFSRRHVHFAHVFKEQAGWQDTLRQFHTDGGELYDLEYLTDEAGRRVAAFGYWAGFVGAAVAVLGYCAKQRGTALAPLTGWADKNKLIEDVRAELQTTQDKPDALVIGALGRCGTGAMELLTHCNIAATAWDQAETAVGGPFDAVRDHAIVVNCVFINSPLPPFTTREHLTLPDRRVQVISDVSCDPFGQYNPVPVYTNCTTMAKPVDEILAATQNDASLELIAIDHLPSLLPRESSDDFSNQLLPVLLDLRHIDSDVWQRAKNVFDTHVKQMLNS
jgi:saccharopine dehydrogenase (NAD+, L-lysine-forming)